MIVMLGMLDIWLKMALGSQCWNRGMVGRCIMAVDQIISQVQIVHGSFYGEVWLLNVNYIYINKTTRWHLRSYKFGNIFAMPCSYHIQPWPFRVSIHPDSCVRDPGMFSELRMEGGNGKLRRWVSKLRAQTARGDTVDMLSHMVSFLLTCCFPQEYCRTWCVVCVLFAIRESESLGKIVLSILGHSQRRVLYDTIVFGSSHSVPRTNKVAIKTHAKKIWRTIMDSAWFKWIKQQKKTDVETSLYQDFLSQSSLPTQSPTRSSCCRAFWGRRVVRERRGLCGDHGQWDAGGGEGGNTFF